MQVIAPYLSDPDLQVHQYEIEPTLGTRGYRIRLSWIERRQVWVADIEDMTTGEGVSGEVVEPYAPIGRTSPHNAAPQGGALIPIPTDGETNDLEWGDLGSRVMLVWYDTDELPEAPEVDDGWTLTA